MRIIDVARRSGVAVDGARTIRAAAQIMEQAGVGSLAVLDGPRPVGIVTDRDLVRRVMAKGIQWDARIDSVMSSPVITVDADADLSAAFDLFRANKVRRLAITQGDQFVGMLSVDDLLIDISSQLADLTRPVQSEVFRAHRDPRPLAAVLK